MIDDQREISGEVGSDRRSARDKWGASAELDDSPAGRSTSISEEWPGGGCGGEEMEPRVVEWCKLRKRHMTLDTRPENHM